MQPPTLPVNQKNSAHFMEVIGNIVRISIGKRAAKKSPFLAAFFCPFCAFCTTLRSTRYVARVLFRGQTKSVKSVIKNQSNVQAGAKRMSRARPRVLKPTINQSPIITFSQLHKWGPALDGTPKPAKKPLRSPRLIKILKSVSSLANNSILLVPWCLRGDKSCYPP